MILFIIKATIALLVFYAFYRLFLVKECMFGFNRFFLIFALCFSLMLPFLQVPFSYQIGVDLFQEKAPATLTSEKSSENYLSSQQRWPQIGVEADPLPTQPDTAIHWYILFIGVYFSGLFFFLVRFIFQLARLTRMIRNNLTLEENDCTYVLVRENILPFTFLHFLFVEKASFQNKTIEKEILFHELTHIRQRHSWDILLVEMLKVVFWFNPVFFLYKKAMQLNHEFMADAAVNAKFRNKAAYQRLLFNKISGNETALSISSPFNFAATKRRLIMMGKSSSFLKTMLFKSISLIVIGFLMVFLSSSQSYESVKIYAENDYEKILAGALKEGNPFELELNKLDLPRLRSAYFELNEKEKSESTPFPFFDDLAFEKLLALQQAYPEIKTNVIFESWPEKKEIEKEIYERWKRTRNISFTIDNRKIENAEIENYQPGDFARFTVRESKEGGLFKKPAYNVKLITQTYYEEKYVKPGKKIEEIQASYSDGAKVAVPCRPLTTVTKAGKITKDLPENYEASIFHQLRIIDPIKLVSEIKKPIKYDSSKSFSIAIFSGEGKPIRFMKLPTI